MLSSPSLRLEADSVPKIHLSGAMLERLGMATVFEMRLPVARLVAPAL
jgi:hypothetical protein